MLKQALDRRAEQGRPIQVGVVGAGRVGTGAICQIGLMKGSRNAVIATSAPSPSFGRASYADVAARTWGSPIRSRPRRMQSEAASRSRLFGAAKRPPKADKIVDCAGGAFVYAMNDLYEVAKAENVVPLGLLIGAKLRCDVPTDKPVTYDMVDVIDNTTLYHLRAMQDAGGAGKFQRAVRYQGCAAGRAAKGGGGICAFRHQFVSRKRSKR